MDSGVVKPEKVLKYQTRTQLHRRESQQQQRQQTKDEMFRYPSTAREAGGGRSAVGDHRQSDKRANAKMSARCRDSGGNGTKRERETGQTRRDGTNEESSAAEFRLHPASEEERFC